MHGLASVVLSLIVIFAQISLKFPLQNVSIFKRKTTTENERHRTNRTFSISCYDFIGEKD
jgi:hypothetical protein